MSDSITTVVVVNKENNAAEKSALYSVLTTLVSLLVIGLLGFGAWWLLSKILPVLGGIYMVAIVIFEAKNLASTKTYSTQTESMQKSLEKFAKNASEPPTEEGEVKLTEDAAWGVMYMIITTIVLGYFLHYTIASLLVYGYGVSFSGHAVALVGLVVTVLYALRTILFIKNVYNALKNYSEDPKPVSKARFRINVYFSKTRSLIALIFVAMLVAANFGFFIGF